MFRHQKEKDVWSSEVLLCGGAGICAVVIALLSAVGYTVFVHLHLLHLENLVQKLQTGLLTVYLVFSFIHSFWPFL